MFYLNAICFFLIQYHLFLYCMKDSIIVWVFFTFIASSIFLNIGWGILHFVKLYFLKAWTSTCFQYLTVFFSLFATLLQLILLNDATWIFHMLSSFHCLNLKIIVRSKTHTDDIWNFFNIFYRIINLSACTSKYLLLSDLYSKLCSNILVTSQSCLLI